jgi:hypothetical protein
VRRVPKQLHKLPVVTHIDDLVLSTAQAKRDVAPRPKAPKKPKGKP